MNNFWGYIAIGLLYGSFGLYSIVTGELLHHRDVPIPIWAGWFYFPIGCWFIFLSVRAMLRGQGKDTPEYSPEELAKARQRDEAARKAEADEALQREEDTRKAAVANAAQAAETSRMTDAPQEAEGVHAEPRILKISKPPAPPKELSVSQRLWKEYAETSKSKLTFAQYMKNTKVRIGLGLMNAGLLAFLGLLLGFESSVLTFSAIALPIAGMLVLAVGTVEVI